MQQQAPGQQGPGQRGPTGHTFPTKSHLPEETRRQSIEVLNRALADTTDLLTQVKFAHWNVRGGNFYQLHELFEDIAERLAAHADDIAERATALGGQAMGTARIAAAASSVPEMRTDAITGPEYVELVAERLAIHDAQLYESLQQVSEREDLDTADLLNEVSRDVSKFRWFLEAHFVTQPSTTGQGGMSQQPGMGTEQQSGTGTARQSGTSPQRLGDHEGGGRIQVQQGGQEPPRF